MTKIVNLRQARKAKARAAKDAEAQANRAKFGRTKAQKARDKDAAARLERHVDGHERDQD